MSNKEKTAKKKPFQEPPLESLEIGGAVYITRLTSKFSNRKNWERPNERVVIAVIPGTIQKIMVKVGDQVEAGLPMLILEAMKMRNEVLAPVGGVIRTINVSVGEQVPKSHLLVELD
ncbi:MAG: acetyl-CoA carboxylase biotin carboxyl carrier protein subunit [Bacteroidia bacterium]|nr:MAG: acetyl-CoA carboxylase biotin carboxyl carrier protein subunit [Bacteroidia bacterium]